MTNPSSPKIPQGMRVAEALARLFNRSKPLGLGAIQPWHEPMTLTEANLLLETRPGFVDYHRGRVMKIRISELTVGVDGWERLYERDNGPGSATDALTGPSFKPSP